MSSLEARHRQAQLVVTIVYLGIPLVFLGLTLWISAEADNWQAALIPLALLAAGWWRRGKSRFKPANWRWAGLTMGGVTAMFTSFYTIVLDSASLALWFLPIGVGGAIIGAALAGYGFRQLMSPAIPELAESPYELSFRMRGLTRLRLSIGADQVALHELMVAQSAEGGQTTERDKRYPLTAVTGVHAVELSGHERLKYPVPMKLAPASSPGPALILQAQGEDWVLPHDDAPVITEILNRRIATVRSGKSS
ncbi:hypothetical protein [Kribbella sp. NPDC023855]|uniref:hypothetical protein n=1 Tax=Kribbella sp. NPDC023855 TaxID=3154698 RepID=UPI0033C50DFA